MFDLVYAGQRPNRRSLIRWVGASIVVAGILTLAPPCIAVELFGPRLALRTGPGPSHAVRADFDNNGIADLAVVNLGSSTVSVVLGDGRGGFDVKPEIQVDAGATSIAAGDFNSDGAADLVVLYFRADALNVWLGDGKGGFARGITLATGSRPQFVVASDFDFDGDEDLAVANCQDDTVSVLLCDGKGGFVQTATVPVGTFPHFVAVADLDGDGMPDLAVANSWSDSISILLGDGTGGFDPGEEILVGVERAPAAVAVDDFDLDGNADLAVAHGADDSFSIWLGDGAGGFRLGQEIPDADTEVRQAPVWIAPGDLDADGDPDLAVANLFEDTVDVLRGDPVALRAGEGGFQKTAKIALPEAPRSLAMDDFTADGALDLAVVLSLSDMLTILPGDGHGGFASIIEIPELTGGQLQIAGDYLSLTSILAADFDGDGLADVAQSNESSSEVTLVRGAGERSFDLETTTRVSVPKARGVAADDFDGDGNLDLAVNQKLQNSVRILLGDGRGGLIAGAEVPTGARPVALVTGDFDRDGDADLAVANSASGSVSVLINDGSGRFPDADGRAFAVGVSPWSLASADFNGDGMPDLAVANQGSDSVTIHAGTGNGDFEGMYGGPKLRIDSPEGIAGLYAIGLAAFGPPITSAGVCGLVELANDGVDIETNACEPLLTEFAGRIAVVDRGGCPFVTKVKNAQDAGAVAVIVANDRPGPPTAMGPGSNPPPITIPSVMISQADGDLIKSWLPGVRATIIDLDADRSVRVGDAPVFLVAGDFDGDGKTDLAAANSGDGTVSVLSGDGQGRFAQMQRIAVGAAPVSLVASDLNLDGLDDLACALQYDDAVGILIAGGGGAFAATPVFHAGRRPLALAAADLDGDGAPDLLAATPLRDSVSLMFNRIHDRVDPNGSNRVDGFDLAGVSRVAGAVAGTSVYRRTEDIDLNGVIDGDDLALVASRFGELMKTASPLRPTVEQTLLPDPDTVTLQPGETSGDLLTLDVVVNDDDDWYSAAEFVVTLEPAVSDPDRAPVLEAVGFDPGDCLSGSLSQVYEVDTARRSEVVVRVTRLPAVDRQGVGLARMLSLKLRARRSGTAVLDFAAVEGRAAPTLLNASGAPVAGVSFVGGGRVHVEASGSEQGGQRVGFAPPLLQFDDTPPGLSAKARLRLSNFGFSDLRVLDVTSTRPEFASFFVMPFAIPPFGSVELPVRFAPVGPGIFAGELIVTSDDPERPQVRVPVVGRSEPSITVTPAHVSFGSVAVGQVPTRRIGIRHRGDAPLVLTGVSVSDAAFTVSTSFVRLDPEGFGSVDVEFRPEAAGEVRAVLTLRFEAPAEQTVVLSLSASVSATP